MFGPSPTFPATGGGSGVGGGSPTSYYRDLVWVDLHVAPGGFGNEETPLNTANLGLGAVPDGGTLIIAGGDASTEPGVSIGARSFTVRGFSGQEASGGQKPVLPTLTYAITTGTQRLAFHEVSTTLVHSGASASLSSFEFFFCPTITLTAGTDASPVFWTGDANCLFSGAGGPGTFNGGTIAGYVANSGAIVVSNCRVTGDLTSSSSVTLANACTFGAGVSVNAPTIWIDASSYANALTAGVTFSNTPTLLSPTAVESDVGTANAAGTTNKNSRVGHVHALTAAVWLAVGATITSPLSVNNQRITNVAAPVSGGDAVNKTYADALASGLKVKTPAVVVATSNQGTMSGTAQTIDGVALNTIGQRVLLTAQSTASQNGLWTVQSGAWTRPADFATGSGAAQSYVLITGGTAGAGSSYYCTTASGSDIVDTNNLTWTLFTQAAVITAGAGLTKTGNTIDVVANADGTIVVAADDVKVGTLISANYADNTIALTRLVNATGQGHFAMRVSSGSGAWEDGTAAQAKSALGIFQGPGWQPVRAATTANITLSGTQTIDGVACIAGDRVLAKDQTTGSARGIYVVASGAWSRALDAASSSQFFGGMTVAISEGTVNGNRVAMLTTDDPITIGSTSLTFDLTRVAAIGAVAPQDVTTGAASIGASGLAADRDHVHHIDAATIASAITAGTGCSFTSTTLNVNANADGTIVANANDIQVGTLIAANYAVNTIALTKLSNAAAQFDLVGRKTASGGSWEDCTPAQLQLVTYSRFVNTGAGLTGGGDLSVDRTISLGTVANSNLADNTIALSRLVNAGAQNHFIMRKSASAGAWEDGSQADAIAGLGMTVGTSGKIPYWNGSTLANNTTFTTDGTSLIGVTFLSGAGTVAGTGFLRMGATGAGAFGKNHALTQDVPLWRWDQFVTDVLYLGSSSSDIGKVAGMRFGIHTGGTFIWEINGSSVIDSDGSTINAHAQTITNVASIAQNGSPSTTGFVRVANNVNGIDFRGAGAYNLTGLRSDSSDNLIDGDQTRVASRYFDVKSGGVYHFRFPSVEHTLTATAFTLNNATSILGNTGVGTANLVGWNTASGVTVGDAAYTLTLNSASSIFTAISGQNFDFKVNSSTKLKIDADKLFIGNSSTPPTTNPSGGGYLWVDNGRLRYRGSAGSVTDIAPA